MIEPMCFHHQAMQYPSLDANRGPTYEEIAIKCRKGKAYYEKRAREDPDPRKAQRAQSNVDWGNLMEKQIIYVDSGERKRIGPEAARAREEQFVRETETLSRRILQEAEEDDASDEDAPRKKRCKGKKRTQKTQASDSRPIDGIFR
ncbi:hypothetical protein CEP54_001126 [Fusarium duplospermum]|uniref:Uncharacterized protein n=1 Tax=Fusarium duplospermum TaxID=1325734 RepID=A0A428R2Z6_9HYPO|nr:hypothetical protein CEP54_001126 [Fusarium duplospermum]